MEALECRGFAEQTRSCNSDARTEGKERAGRCSVAQEKEKKKRKRREDVVR
jgi:hypothetical protein